MRSCATAVAARRAADCRSWLCRPASGGTCRRAPDWLDAKIVGVGWKKSGTTSLQAAFQRLHLEPECQCGSLSALSRHKATQDSRFSWNVSLVASAARKWPGAKFVLTYREPRAWNASVTHWTTVVKPWAAAQYARLMGRGAMPGSAAFLRAAKESEIPNFKGSFLGRFPLVSADFWTSDHLSERARAEHSWLKRR
jgi:hypothetical protein